MHRVILACSAVRAPLIFVFQTRTDALEKYYDTFKISLKDMQVLVARPGNHACSTFLVPYLLYFLGLSVISLSSPLLSSPSLPPQSGENWQEALFSKDTRSLIHI